MPRLLPKTERHNESHLPVSWLSAKSLLLGPDCMLPYRACRQEQEKVLKFKVTIYKYTTRTPTELHMLKSELDLPLWPVQWTPQAMWKSLCFILTSLFLEQEEGRWLGTKKFTPQHSIAQKRRRRETGNWMNKLLGGCSTLSKQANQYVPLISVH